MSNRQFIWRAIPKLALLVVMAIAGVAEATEWVTVDNVGQRRVEIDQSSVINASHGARIAWGRITLDASTAGKLGYRTVKAMNRYNCQERTFSTIKRVFLDDDSFVVREEDVREPQKMIAAVGSVDEKLFNRICQPPSLAEVQRIIGGKPPVADEGGNKGKLINVSATAEAVAPVVDNKKGEPKKPTPPPATAAVKAPAVKPPVTPAPAATKAAVVPVPVTAKAAPAPAASTAAHDELKAIPTPALHKSAPAKMAEEASVRQSPLERAMKQQTAAEKTKQAQLDQQAVMTASAPEHASEFGVAEKMSATAKTPAMDSKTLENLASGDLRVANTDQLRALLNGEPPVKSSKAANGEHNISKENTAKQASASMKAAPDHDKKKELQIASAMPTSAPAMTAKKLASIATTPDVVRWAYNGDSGPENWAKLNPSFASCGKGERQSPINIVDDIRVDLPPIQFNYGESFFRVLDTGNTVQVSVGPGNSMRVLGKEYDLVQFNFHRPSEVRINGKAFDMEVDLVHKDIDGKQAIVAVLLERGSEHPLVQKIWNNLPLEKNMDVAPEVTINLKNIIPPSPEYYTYMGSLTSPPCTEGVLWMVMKAPVTVSSEQINIFSRLYPLNARPLQALNDRLIKGSR